MLRQALPAAACLAVAALIAGCGDGMHPAAAPTTTTPPVAAAACGEVVLDVQFISQLISNNVEAMANSIHPKQLAERTGTAQQSLLVAARLVERFQAPPSLAHARAQLIHGLQLYAADFGRARRAVLKKDMANASQQLTDPVALGEVKEATKAIDHACRA
jgi:hypothetical protein